MRDLGSTRTEFTISTGSSSIATKFVRMHHADRVIDVADRPVLRDVALEFLRQAAENCRSIVLRLRETIPEYSRVPEEDLGRTTAAIVQHAGATILRATETGELHAEVDLNALQPLTDLVRRRISQHFPADALTHSIHLAARYALQDFDRIADGRAISASSMLAIRDYAWQFATDAASVVGAIGHEVAVEASRRDVGRRTDFVRGILLGTSPPERINAEAPLFGVDPTAMYHAVRAHPESAAEESAITAALRRSSPPTRGPLLAVLDDDLVGIVPTASSPTWAVDTLLAVSDAAPLRDLAEPFREATLTLRTARAFGRGGVVRLADLGPFPLALVDGEFAHFAENNYLAGLDTLGDLGSGVATTVWTLLQLNQNVDEAARVLHMHRNTIRYRLNRFREVTGLDIKLTEHYVLAWWCLARRFSHLSQAAQQQ